MSFVLVICVYALGLRLSIVLCVFELVVGFVLLDCALGLLDLASPAVNSIQLNSGAVVDVSILVFQAHPLC